MVKRGFVVGFIFVVGLVIYQGCDDENYEFSLPPQFNVGPPIIELVEELETSDLEEECVCEDSTEEDLEECDHEEEDHEEDLD